MKRGHAYSERFDVHYSTRYKCIVLCVYCLVFLGLLWGPILWTAKCALLILLLALACLTYLDIRRNGKIESVEVRDSKTYLVLRSTTLHTRSDAFEVTLHPSSLITAFLQVLRFKPVHSAPLARAYTLVLLSDSASSDTLRRLRVWLRRPQI